MSARDRFARVRATALRPLLVASLLAAACATACEGKTTTVLAATQLLVSIDFAPDLRQQADHLRASVWTLQATGWKPGSSVSVPTAKANWPLDLPLLPSTPSDDNAEVEVVLQALSGSTVLAETRVLSRFVPNVHGVLKTSLAACAGHPAGFVCSDASCHGDACAVCAPTGTCVPVVATTVEAPAAAIDAGNPVGSTGPDNDAGHAGGPAPVDAGSEPDAHSTSSPEAGSSQVDAPDASSPASVPSPDAGPTPNVCPPDHGCLNPYPCVPTALGYTCRGQLADWPMSDGFASSKYKKSYTSDGVTVVDNVTKLEWETNVPEVHAGCTHYSETFTDNTSTTTTKGPVGEWCSLTEARQHCDALVLSGKDDWRLPSMIELASLLDHSRLDARYAVDPAYFNDINWSSYVSTSLYPSAPASFRAVDFIQRSTWKEQQGEVRCVRGGAEPPFAKPADRYSIDTVADTVTDNATKLIWQRTASTQTFADGVAGIAAYCQNGFRLPTPNELLTLVDPTREKPAIDTSAFPNTPSAKFWTVPNDRGSAVSFANGDMGIYVEGDAGYVRCVR